MASDAPFAVHCPRKELAKLKQWGILATSLNMKDAYLDALKHVNEQLSVSPIVWGDPLFRYRDLGLLVCQKSMPCSASLTPWMKTGGRYSSRNSP